MKFDVQLMGPPGKNTRAIELRRDGDRWRIVLDGQPVDGDAVEIAPHTFSILLRGESHEARVFPNPDGSLSIQTGAHKFTAEIIDPRAWRGRRHGTVEAEGRQQIIAPMPGKVVRLLVKTGDQVEAGQGILVVEAMKMQNEIRSPKSGIIERIVAQEGQLVTAGEVLAWVE